MENSISSSKYPNFFHRSWWRARNAFKKWWYEIMMNDKADKVIKELFYSIENRYQNNLESVKGRVSFSLIILFIVL